jgi:hypothetical protein
MPFRHTDKGWYWGSKGPFASKAKALQVARAAYASGYKEETEMEYTIENFAAGLLHGVTNAHILHLKADTYAVHKAMGHFYSDLGDLADSYIEGYQGKYGKITAYGSEYNPPDESALVYMRNFMKWMDTYREFLPKDTYLMNIADEITQVIASTINKLAHYK